MDINNAVGEIQSLMRTNSRHLPFPLAITAQNIEYYCQEFVRTGFTSRYLLLKNLIDFVEIYAKFVSVVYLSECRAICASPGNQEMFLKIRQALVDSKQARRKISYSLGDWLAIAEMAAKTLGHFTDKMVFPELINLVIDDPGKKKSKRIDAFADVCNNIVSIRNKRLGHGYVNESEETDFDEDFEKTLACVGLLLKTANKYFEEYDLVIAFYLNHQNNVYSWKVHGIEISEFFSRGSAESCDKLIKLKKGELQLALSPFAYYTTGALSLEYYYLMDSILTSNRTVVEDIDYLGIGHLKSKHYRLKSFECPQVFLKLFSEFLGIKQDTSAFHVQSLSVILRSEIESRISRTVDRPDIRCFLHYLLEKERILFVEASPGAGKTVLASWWASQGSVMIFYNRYGANSDPVTQMYRHYYLQISSEMGMDAENTNDPIRLKTLFNSLLQKYLAERKSLILLFDGFDELPEECYPEYFSFARELPASVNLVIFSRPVPRQMIDVSVHSEKLPTMTIKEIKSIPAISELGLQADVVKKVFDFSGGNPLISILAAREASTNSSLFSQSLKEFYLGFYKNLLICYDKTLISSIFAVLIYAARPLRFEELHELFAKFLGFSDLAQISQAFRKISRFISVGVDGSCSLFHKSFADAILPEISAEVVRNVHYGLAQFLENSSQFGDKHFIPHHLLQSGRKDVFLAKSKTIPKHFIDYFVSHAKHEKQMVAPQFTNNSLDLIFGEMLTYEDPDIRLIVAQVLYYFGFWRDAELLYECVYNSSDSRLTDVDRLRLSITLGALYKNLDKWEKARTILQDSIERVTGSKTLQFSPLAISGYNANEQRVLCRLYNNCASILYDSGTSRKEVEKLFDMSRIMAERCGDELCRLAADIGKLCYLIESASYQEAKELIDNLAISFKKYPVEELYLRLNRTAYCLRMDKSDEVREVFDFNVDDADTMKSYLYRLQNRQLSAYFFNNLAVYYYVSGNSKAAAVFIKTSIEISRAIEDFCMLSGALINSGIMLNNHSLFDEAEAIAIRIGDQEELAACKHNRDALTGCTQNLEWLGEFYEEINDPDGLLLLGRTRPWVMTQFVDLFL